MRTKFWMLIMLLVVASTSFSQIGATLEKEKATDLTEKVPVDKKVRIGKLDNGLTYYIRANKKPENRAQFRLVVDAGSILEDNDQLGLAHFTEHMAFNGTKHYKGNDMISELQKKGIEFGRGINAWTSFDETVYYVELPTDSPEMIDMGFKILDGWASGLLFEGEEIEKERGVILEEWRLGLGADERLRKATWPIMLKDSRYADRLPIGTYDVVKNFKHDVIKRFYEDWYRTDLQAIVIVGDFDVNAIEKQLKSYFEGYKKTEKPRERKEYGIPNNKEPLIAVATDKEATNTSVSFFWKHKKAPQGTVGDYRQNLARSLVNGMLNARFTELGEKASAPFIYAYGSYGGFLGRSVDAFYCGAAPKENEIEKTIEVLLTELKRVDQHGFLQTELDRQKEELLNSYQKAAKEENKTQNVSFAQEYTNNFLEGEVIPGIRQEYRYAKEFMDDITLEEINKMVSEWITDENFVLNLTAPEKTDLKVPTTEQIGVIVANMKNIQTEPYVDNFKDEPLLNKELKGGKIVSTKENKKLGYTEYTLSNGVRVVLKPTTHKADEILVRAYSLGGTSLYEDNEYFTASQASTIVDQSGIADFDNTQLMKKLKGTNLSISPFIGDLNEGFSGNCSPKDLETLLQLTYLYFDQPRKDQEAFDKYVSQMKNQYKFIRENPRVAFMETLYTSAYPNSKRMILIPSEENFNSLNLDRAYEIYKERFADASDFVFFFVGNFSIDTTLPLIEKYLGSLPNTGRKEMWKNRHPKFATGKIEKMVKKGSDNQGMFAIVGEGKFDYNEKTKLAAKMLNDAMSITMLEVIREKLGGTYSPQISIDYEKYPEGTLSWTVMFGCDPEKAPELEKAVLEVINSYIKNGPDEETLNKAKEQAIRTRETQLNENGFWTGYIYGSYYFNENRDDIDKYADQIKSVTAKDVKDIAKKYINTKNYVRVILEPETKANETK